MQRFQRRGHVSRIKLTEHISRNFDQRQDQRIGNRDVDSPTHICGSAAHLVHSGNMHAGHEELVLDTRGNDDTIDVTEHAKKAIANAGLRDGICTVFVAHSTCGVTMIEFEPGCNADLARVMENIAPIDDDWEHNERNADTNGHSHVRAGLIGPSVTVPFADGELCMGTFQRIVCIDFDDRPRQRRLVLQLLGV